MTLTRLKLSRFDGVVLATLQGLALLTGLIAWRGDQIGLRLVEISPPEGATQISTRAVMQVTFDQPLAAAGSDQLFSITPPVSGTVSWAGPTLSFVPETPLTPDTTYRVELSADIRSQQGRPFRDSLAWQFQTRSPLVLYIAPDAEANDQFFTISPDRGRPTQLTQEPYGVWDYTLSPDSSTLVYAALRPDGGSDLWRIGADGSDRQLLLACPDATCSGAAWSPDNQRLVYERRPMLAPGAAPGPPRLWWLNLADGQTLPLFQDNQMLGYGPVWSPDGRWLSYVAPSDQGIQIYNVEDGRSLIIPSRMGGLGVWSPQGDSILVTDVQRQNEGFAVHLLRADPGSGQLVDLSGEEERVEDSSPAWSPDGAWIALTRKAAGASMGKQIWLMRPDGSEAQGLTNDTDIHHGLPAWSPDGRYLTFQRYPLKELGAEPAVWLLDIQTGQLRELVKPGSRAIWLP